MTKVLTLDLLRAFQAPWDRWDEVARIEGARPRLVAHWEVAADGRLVCRWRTVARDTDDPPA